MRRPRSLRTAVVPALALLAAALVPGDALGDAVSRKPIECPPGAFADVDHTDTWCREVRCLTDTDCAQEDRWSYQKPKIPMVCREQPLCIEEQHLVSRSGYSWGKPIVHENASAECGGTATCTASATCVHGKRCVPRLAPIPRGCACDAAGGPELAGAGMAALGLAALGLGRRRMRARRAPG
jgi:MYXO-CTERM domain-containing protein